MKTQNPHPLSLIREVIVKFGVITTGLQNNFGERGGEVGRSERILSGGHERSLFGGGIHTRVVVPEGSLQQETCTGDSQLRVCRNKTNMNDLW